MIPQPPPGQGPIDPRGAFGPPAGPGQMGLPSRPMGPASMGPPPGGFGYPMPYPPPPRRRGGVGKALFLTLVIIILVCSVLMNCYFLVSDGISSAGTTQNTVSPGKSDQKIAVIPLTGLIDGDAAATFKRLLTTAENDSNVKAVVIEIDSPGGTVTASDEIYHRMQQFKSRRPNIGMTVTMGSLATSGGYYTACGADYIFAQPTTITANIGVLMPRYNLSKLAEEWGIKDATVVSTGATYKNAGSMLNPEAAHERAYYQGLIDSAFGTFKSVVEQGRGSKLVGSIDAIADGKALTAQQALDKGLIDELGYFDDACKYAADHASPALDKPLVVRYQAPPTLMQLLLSKSDVGPPNAKNNVTVNGVNINLDANALEQFSTPRLMYLWRGQ